MKTTKRYNYLIVGAGLTGAVLARELSDAGARCLVIEKRSVTGGNIRDEMMDGVNVHLHGPHLFHTNSRRIWDYVNRFSEWMFFEYRIKAMYKGVVYSFPPNLMTYQQLGIDKDSPDLLPTLYNAFFRGYSAKQWGRSLEDIPEDIIKRIPIRYDYDDRYFSDRYQGLPLNGYSSLVDCLLSGVNVQTGTDYLANRYELDNMANITIYTGMIDALYDYQLGRLEYRSLRFETYYEQSPSVRMPTLNYTESTPDFTRIHNWGYFGYRNINANILTREYPRAYNGNNEPYYPVNDERNNAIYKQYQEMANKEGVMVAGRLGRYRYYNMDQAIGAALHLADELCRGNNGN